MRLGFSRELVIPFDQAIGVVTERLKEEGFGIITSIDFKDVFKKKLGIEFSNYVILGACHPTSAHRSLLIDEQVGLLLPCNVAVYEKEGRTNVAIFDPMLISTLTEKPDILPIAEEVARRLRNVLESL